MDFRQYQYVLKVAELQNMTKAAAALYITQPSLSH
ncbi:MAG: LysR family transcriptional regulator, partial [Eubacteriales bacterium]|nr:LysR family transcriptional regulator [Eubacteriales bacterium]